MVAADALRSALDSWRAGVVNITAATTVDSGLLTARLAQVDAQAAARAAAASLAFVLDAMTSAEAAEGAASR